MLLREIRVLFILFSRASTASTREWVLLAIGSPISCAGSFQLPASTVRSRRTTMTDGQGRQAKSQGVTITTSVQYLNESYACG
jgi:hypothetical protein